MDIIDLQSRCCVTGSRFSSHRFAMKKRTSTEKQATTLYLIEGGKGIFLAEEALQRGVSGKNSD